MTKVKAVESPSAWETVEERTHDKTDRLAVPGGWVYRTTTMEFYHGEFAGVAMATTFVPDFGHSATPLVDRGLRLTMAGPEGQ